jgi:hypothetical protein
MPGLSYVLCCWNLASVLTFYLCVSSGMNRVLVKHEISHHAHGWCNGHFLGALPAHSNSVCFDSQMWTLSCHVWSKMTLLYWQWLIFFQWYLFSINKIAYIMSSWNFRILRKNSRPRSYLNWMMLILTFQWSSSQPWLCTEVRGELSKCLYSWTCPQRFQYNLFDWSHCTVYFSRLSMWFYYVIKVENQCSMGNCQWSPWSFTKSF